MHKRHTEFKYTFPIYFNLLIGHWDWIVKREALDNKMIEMTIQVEAGGIRHQSMEKLNDVCISSEMYERHLKDSWDLMFGDHFDNSGVPIDYYDDPDCRGLLYKKNDEDEDKITIEQWEDHYLSGPEDEDEDIDVLMSDKDKEPYDLSMPMSEEEYEEEKGI